MADEDDGPIVEVLNEAYDFLGPRKLQKITFPPGVCSDNTYTDPYVVIAVTEGILTIETDDQEPYELPLVPSTHYARTVPVTNETVRVKVCNYTDNPIVIYKA